METRTHTGWHFDIPNYSKLPEALYRQVDYAWNGHTMVLWNHALAQRLGIEKEANDPLDVMVRGVKAASVRGQPYAQAYAGHQFGHLSVLGDGRALVLGEHVAPSGTRYDIALKGVGPTPFARGGDGKATLGAMLREYIFSLAMESLGIATTGSLGVYLTGESVLRESKQQAAVLIRVASSHIRVGTFQYAALQGPTMIQALFEVVLQACYEKHMGPEALLAEMIDQYTDLLVHWMRVGFIHGVMNTDNVALSCQTLDYGPCAFLDEYDVRKVFSSIDHQGRYAYGNQPIAGYWNMARFAESLLPIMPDTLPSSKHRLEKVLSQFPKVYAKKWDVMMCRKLGLWERQEEDEALVFDLLTWMQQEQADYTDTFRGLSDPERHDDVKYQSRDFKTWSARWQKRLQGESSPLHAVFEKMRAVNPEVIARNHVVEKTINAAEKGDFSMLTPLIAALHSPYKASSDAIALLRAPKPDERIVQTYCGT